MSMQSPQTKSPAPNSPTPSAAPTNSQEHESPLVRFGSLRLTQNNLISLGIGAIVGLALGLLIGWVWWPVEWQGAGLGELNGPARAAYLAAVSDVFAASDGPDAIAAAQQRLAPLGAELTEQFDAAIRYYAGIEPPDRAEITNLVKLAMALQLPLESVAAQADLLGASAATEEMAGQTTEQPAATGAAAATPAPSGATNAGGGRWTWLWVILLGAILVGGGVFVLRYVARRRPPHAHGVPARPQDGAPKPASTAAITGAASASAWSSQTGVTSGSAPASGRTPPPTGQGAASNLQATIPPAAPNAAVAGGSTYSYLNPAPRNGQASEHAFDDEEFPVSGAPAARTGVQGAASGAPGADADADADADGDDDADGTASPLPAPASNTAAPVPVWAAAPARVDRYPVLHSYTATYQLGLENFDFAKNIPNPAGAGFLGEYGMMIPERLGTVNNNLEQVVAIEVNLFDKTDEAEIKTVTRFLLSEYAMDHLYDQFDRERRGVDPISAQPGTRFALEGRQLLLDCVIREVVFTPEHYFQKMTVDMTARRKVSA